MTNYHDSTRYRQAKAKVEEIKYSGTGSLGSRRIVDEFESHLSEANSKCERNKLKYERIAKILINVKVKIRAELPIICT